MKTSKKIAECLNIDIQQARQVRGLIQGLINPDIFDSVHNWCRQCYNEPSNNEKIIEALNEVIEGYGIESQSYGDDQYFSYVNMGDTYSATIIYDDGEYIFTSWGDYIEEIERREHADN